MKQDCSHDLHKQKGGGFGRRPTAKQPASLLCDEPTGALDSKTGIRVLKALEHINREMKTTVTIIPHNAMIGEIADHLVE